MDRETFCYVTYSDETAELFEVGFMPYSNKNGTWSTFAFEIKHLVTTKQMTDKEKKKYEDAMLFFGSTDDDEKTIKRETLAGLGNGKLRYSTAADSTHFLGYIYNVNGFNNSGQKALEWFAERSAKMRPKEELLEEGIPDAFKKEYPEGYEDVYFRQYSSKTTQELADLVGMKLKEKKVAAKGQKPPQLTTTPDYRGSLPSTKAREAEEKKVPIPGVPTSRVKVIDEASIKEAVELLGKAVNTGKANIQVVFDLIFKSIVNGTLDPDKMVNGEVYKYSFLDAEGKTASFEGEDPDAKIAIRYEGFAGDRDVVNKKVADILKEYPKELYDTAAISPFVYMKMAMRREKPIPKKKEESPVPVKTRSIKSSASSSKSNAASNSNVSSSSGEDSPPNSPKNSKSNKEDRDKTPSPKNSKFSNKEDRDKTPSPKNSKFSNKEDRDKTPSPKNSDASDIKEDKQKTPSPKSIRDKEEVKSPKSIKSSSKPSLSEEGDENSVIIRISTPPNRGNASLDNTSLDDPDSL